ncbi:MAG: hypothetical protein M3Z04_16985 [Chloroflexota bacterium]|nr:hypothetical protein [Chloroflexota bacterium]
MRPPTRAQVQGFRVALVSAIFLNLVALWLVLDRYPPPPAIESQATALPTIAAAGPTVGSTAVAPAPTVVALAPSLTPRLPPPPATGTPVAPAPLLTPSAQVQHPGGKVRGFNVPVWAPDFTVALPAINSAAALDANWVALVSHWYVSSAVPYTGGGIFREEGSLGKGERRTAGDTSLGTAIDFAHAAGLKVLLKPHVDWTEGGWRGWFYFKDEAARADWWTSYRAMISDTVQLALTHHAEGICIGTEFFSINKEADSAAEWIGIIRAIRAAGYTGQLTYAANWGYGADTEYNRPGLAGVWEQLDFVGIDAYYPLSDEQNPSLDTLVAGWRNGQNAGQQDHFAQLQSLAQRTGKSIVFTEVGYPDKDFAAKDPTNDTPAPPNDALQARAATALYAVWSDVPWWGGALWWQAGPIQNTHSILGRPISDVLRAAWARQAVGSTP